MKAFWVRSPRRTSILWLSVLSLAILCQIGPAWGQQDVYDSLIQRGGGKTKPTRQFTHPLTKEHGPIMVRVASFVADKRYSKIGTDEDLSANYADYAEKAANYAEKLANELVEKHHIDAYVFEYQRNDQRQYSKEWIQEYEAKYGVKPKLWRLQTESPKNFVVLAGQFDSFKSRKAQRLLDKIQKIHPESVPTEVLAMTRFGQSLMMQEETEDLERRGLLGWTNKGPKWKKGEMNENPLSNAMLVRSPLAPKVEVDRQIKPAHAKMLIELNEDEPLSVYKNLKPVTIAVARFRGMKTVDENKASSLFKRMLGKKKKSGMELAAGNALSVAQYMRAKGFEAYVFHGKHASIVCVGGYKSPNDPRLKQDIKTLAEFKIGAMRLSPMPLPTPRHPTD